jgi:uncharacterized protein YcfL
MKKIFFLAFVIAFVFAACNSDSDNAKKAIPKETITVDTITKENMNQVTEQLYACSMHPEVTGKKDEKCSKCGMNLAVPVKNAETPK